MAKTPDITRGMSPEQRAVADVLTFARWWGQDWAQRRLHQATLERATLETERGRGHRCGSR